MKPGGRKIFFTTPGWKRVIAIAADHANLPERRRHQGQRSVIKEAEARLKRAEQRLERDDDSRTADDDSRAADDDSDAGQK